MLMCSQILCQHGKWVPIYSVPCLQAMSDWDIKSGSRVLVHAGSSGVGTWVLQIAKVQLCSKFAMLPSALDSILPRAADTWRR